MHSSSAFFVTLTYDDEHVPITDNGLQTVDKEDVQKFFKRLRKDLGKRDDFDEAKPFRYYLVSEYGPQTLRPHYHGIFFNLPRDYGDTLSLIHSNWQKGFVSVYPVLPAMINYVTKYCITRKSKKNDHIEYFLPDEIDDRSDVFALVSRRPGIGYQYLDRCTKWHQDHPDGFFATLPGGQKIALPRYFATKLYLPSDLQRHARLCERLALEKEHNPTEYDWMAEFTKRLYKRIDKMQKKHNSI